jgi:hypothetical protein
VQQFPDINKLCDGASCWIYEYIGILLGAHPILHISRIKVKELTADNIHTQFVLHFSTESFSTSYLKICKLKRRFNLQIGQGQQMPRKYFFLPKNNLFSYRIEERQIKETGLKVGEKGLGILGTGSNQSSSSF